MILRRNVLAAAAALPLLPGLARAATAPALKMTLKYGDVTIKLRPDLAPLSAQRLVTLTAQGFYNGCEFFRVIEGFMAQTGDPTNTGAGSSPLPDLPAEFTQNASFLTGTVGMARAADPNSGNCQFFICFDPATSLDGQYTIVGQVVAGMAAVQQIKKGDPDNNGAVTNPDSIIKMVVL